MIFTKESILANLEAVEDEIREAKKRFNNVADILNNIKDEFNIKD